MKRLLIIAAILTGITLGGFFPFKKNGPKYERLQSGDIVFQDTGGEQGEAVEAATKSKYTHCGVVFEQERQLYVLEAVQPVKVVTLDSFRKRSKKWCTPAIPCLKLRIKLPICYRYLFNEVKLKTPFSFFRKVSSAFFSSR